MFFLPQKDLLFVFVLFVCFVFFKVGRHECCVQAMVKLMLVMGKDGLQAARAEEPVVTPFLGKDW